ncbi:MAG: chitin disaccharide deacetylase [Firmicutes bacterium]|nr:chitin disaccharide deacetylase [Bacillota bacterium]MCL1953119.1 chitin disaccharide deacetylase [Bacillota bacterium]
MKIIFNADDFGLSKGVNLGILETFDNGVVRSATIMPNAPQFEHAIQIAKRTGIKVGVHLTLTCGKSLLSHNNITDKNGNFAKLDVFEQKSKDNKLDLIEIEKEYEAQIQKVLDTGLKLTHLDSHHHTHMLDGVIDIAQKLANKYNVGLRGKTTYFSDEFYGESAKLDDLKILLKKHCDKSVVELMCHPSYVDAYLLDNSRYNTNRARELSVLTSSELLLFLKDNGWQLCSYGDIV